MEKHGLSECEQHALGDSRFANGSGDGMLISKTLLALGFAGFGSSVSVNSAGNPIIILKGYLGLRDAFLRGTTFLATNPKMIQMGLGMRGISNVAKGGFMLGLVVSVGIESIDFILNDEKTMYDLVGAIGVEAVKGGLAVAAGMLFAAAAGITTVAVLPLMLLAVVTFAAGVALNRLDSHFQIKEAVIAALKELPETVGAAGRKQAYLFDVNFKRWVGRQY